MLEKTLENRKIWLFCDFHGHSRKKNIFMYGCNNIQDSERNKERIFPLYFFNYFIFLLVVY